MLSLNEGKIKSAKKSNGINVISVNVDRIVIKAILSILIVMCFIITLLIPKAIAESIA